MKAYHYNPTTFEYTGRCVEVELNPMWNISKPLKEKWLVPFGFLLVEPYKASVNKVNVLNHDMESWSLQDDYRGIVYYKKDGTAKKIDKIGETIPDGCLVDFPPTTYHTFHDGNFWQIDIDKAKSDLLQKAFSQRKEIETSGVNITDVSCLDFRLSTDDKGQTKISNAYYEAKELLGSAETTDWYTLSGWREVTNADIIVMAKAVRSHVKKTFSEMRRIQEEIEALESIEDIENYQINFDN